MKKGILLSGVATLALISVFTIVVLVQSNQPEAESNPFLADIDYMLYVLENNFGAFDVAYWAHGVDIRAIVESLREAVLADPEMNEDEFFALLYRKTGPLVTIGHFSIMGPEEHLALVGTLHRSPAIPAAAFARLSHPQVLAHYKPRHPTPDCDIQELRAIRWAETISEARIDLFVGRLSQLGEVDLADSVNEAFERSDTDELIRLRLLGSERIGELPNVETEIIEEGRIALLTVNSFMIGPDTVDEFETIFAFYEDIRDYDHLIVDIRNNSGGFLQYFVNAIVRPIISSEIEWKNFVFIAPGRYSREVMSGVEQTHLANQSFLTPSFTPLYSSFTSAENIVDTYDLPELVVTDIERMGYAFHTSLWIAPEVIQTGLWFWPEQWSAFGGKLWLLTDSGTGSATELAARFAKNTGFATLVGERTGGNIGGPRSIVALPNSGIIFRFDMFYLTDDMGRPFEAGTEPHHFNREGYDALETVLQLIAEGQY